MSPVLDPYFNTAPNMEGTQNGIIILTTTHMSLSLNSLKGIIQGSIIRLVEGDALRLDYIAPMATLYVAQSSPLPRGSASARH